MQKTFPRLLTVATCVVLLGVLALPALANGAPVKVFLNYLPEMSTYGPVNARGVAEISIGEAWIHLTGDGMPKLKDAMYQVWITNAETQEYISLGTFNADANGHVAFEAELEDIPIAEYRYMLITVEASPDASPNTADTRITIAGVFPSAQLLVVSGTPYPTKEARTGTVVIETGAPETLPVTGDTGPSVLGLAIILAGIGVVSAIVAVKHHVGTQEVQVTEDRHLVDTGQRR